MIICFEDKDKEKDEQLLLDIYTKYANAKNIERIN
jgi:hypothetical protein